MPVLVHIPYSPWSARARFGLEAQQIRFTVRNYIPTLSEPGLRVRLGDPFGRISLPILFREEGPPIRDSFDIVHWGAERSSVPLITPENEAAVRAWNERASRWLEAGRARTTPRVMADRVALRESLPPVVRPLGGVGLAIGWDAARRLLRKYGARERTAEQWREVLVAGLSELRSALAGRTWLLESFSYADITAAFGLSFLSPHGSAPLGPRSRLAWTEPDLAEEYSDLLGWRDRVVAHARSLRADDR